MQPPKNARAVFCVGCGAYALLGGLVSFLGWVADIPRLTNWDGNGISIQPNATVAAMTAGAAVIFLTHRYKRVAALLGALLAFLGGSVLFEWVSGADLGVDTVLMFERTWGRVGVIFPGRMGPPGATSWTILGIGVVLAATQRPGSRGRQLIVPLGIVTLAISSLSLIGYAYGASPLFTIPTATVIALQTSTFVLAVSLGLILNVPELGLARLLGEDSAAGALVRRVVPAVIAIPIALGYVRLVGERAGLFDLAFGTAARTLVEIGLLLTLLGWTASSISRQTRRRERAEARMAAHERMMRLELEADLADSRLLQRMSTEIIREEDVESIYTKIVAAAIGVMRARWASMQMLEPVGERLKLLAGHGFDADATRFWGWVDASSHSVCAMAVRARQRVIVPDVLASDEIAGTDDLATYQRMGIRAVQSTPLISRDGSLLGMISTHWDHPHTPSERDLRLLDILARQAADLIERTQARDRLVEADQRKDRFLATLAHELRNPLAPIRNAVDVMKIAKGVGPDVTWARDIIDRQVALMSRLLDDLLDVSRIVGDKLELRKQTVDLGAALRSAVELCRPLLEKLEHRLVVDLPPEPILLHADPVRLGQVFGNLLNNACRYTAPQGQIRMSAEREDDTAVVRVIDTGVGIPSAELTRIFELFSQVDPSLESSQGGLGIGLYLVKRLVDMHGGRIEAHSRGAGLGSEFVVRLPAPRLSTIDVSVRTQQQPSPPVAADRQRILVVDDNVDAAECLAVLLSTSGHDTHVAHDGLTALQAAQALRPDVVVMDIGLSRMDGFAVCRRIREQSWGRDVMLIAVTGWGQELDRRNSKAAGFDYHLVKPVEHTALLDLLGSTPPKPLTHSLPSAQTSQGPTQ